VKIDLQPEKICCDECDATHLHMECPACRHKFAGTDLYDHPYELEVEEVIRCEECGVRFKLIGKGTGGDAKWMHEDWEWEQLTEEQWAEIKRKRDEETKANYKKMTGRA
jgi:DNA-directed RNA polymerase subunit RPC12/RpoP